MKYIPTIGIECHVQLKTKTKLFAAVDNDAREKEPNTTVSPICFGMPGVLPVLNEKAVELGIRAGLALRADIAEWMKFDRKHYFYPDLPLGYQITQFDEPIIKGGTVSIIVDGKSIDIQVERAHLEADAGKLTHPSGADYSLVDLNRVGTPLLEIVSQADMHSPAEARAYAQELYNLMKYAEVSDVDLYHGNMRFDVNVSVAPEGASELGTRSETKNLNSFRSVERAAAYEIKRQIKELEIGNAIIQETRGWDDAAQVTKPQRGKENPHDYRYFPDPDIPPVSISRDKVAAVRKDMPLLPFEIRQTLGAARVQAENIETLLSDPEIASIALNAAKSDENTFLTRVVNWLIGPVTAEIKSTESFEWSQAELTVENLRIIAELVESGKLNSNGAEKVLIELLHNGGEPKQIADEQNLIQMTDSSAIESIVDEVIADNDKAAQDVRDGDMRAIGYLVGQVMKQSKGQANPQIASKLLREKLSS